jgi:transcriptional regulator with XRE-family HTH domain
MGMKAVGSYLRALREAGRIGRGALARELGTDDSQIERIEKGQIDTRGSLLFAFIHAVRGNAEHIMQLLLADAASEEEGRALAEVWLAEARGDPAALDERRRRALSLIDDLLADPRALDQLLGYGDRLREELTTAREQRAGSPRQSPDG